MEDDSTLRAKVKFQEGAPNEILIYFDDMYRRPRDWQKIRPTSLQYTIERGTLFIKHYNSCLLLMQDISELKDLAKAACKKAVSESTEIEFTMKKIDLYQ